jgi:molecular chaperone HtpG
MMETDTQTEQHGIQHEFQAEIRQLLDIVVHSLYTDREIFIRELVSNASDALEKLRLRQVESLPVRDADLEPEIRITLDEENKQVVIQDTGIGMAEGELVDHLGTIARSGTKEFIKELKEEAKKDSQLIGQFGLGFYSAFMVAEKVVVESAPAVPEQEGGVWECDGSGSYSVEKKGDLKRGTKITLHLREDAAAEFTKKDTIQQIIKKYSNFVPFPIFLEDERINTIDAIWLKQKSDITDEQYNDFYQFVAGAFDEPLFRLHLSFDAPININALLFVPSANMEKLGMGRGEKQGVSLYCNKVLIERHADRILPEWLRFVRGVIDSADLPLSVSREAMQDSALAKKVNKIVTGRLLKFFAKQADKEPEKFASLHREFGIFFKEGVVSGDPEYHQDLAPLLRFATSKTKPGELASLQEILDRMPEDQNEFYFINGPSREAIESGPYLEGFKAKNIEVIYTFETVDDFVFTHLREFEGKAFRSADEADLKIPGEEKPDDAADDASDDSAALPKEKTDALAGWIASVLGDQVSSVRASSRLTDSPAVAINDAPGMSSAMQRMMNAMSKIDSADKPGLGAMPIRVRLEINPKHDLIQQLDGMRTGDPALAELLTRQLFDNTLVAAGLLDDPRSMLQRINTLMLRAAGAEVEMPEPTPVAEAEEKDPSDAPDENPTEDIIEAEAEVITDDPKKKSD